MSEALVPVRMAGIVTAQVLPIAGLVCALRGLLGPVVRSGSCENTGMGFELCQGMYKG